ncbi:MAG: C4-type zinc ribbon domain-containing protein [Thermodesulfobacteriota bacterium]|nr:MAG: C4-type zinc ribbon domain-containing protein [Thermodesulfobacteriota bacterium]
MIETLRVLEEIQRIDLEIKSLGDEEKEYLGRMEALGAELERAGKAAAALEEDLAGLQEQLKGIEERIRESAERISKDEGRLNSVKNDRELNALTKEINGANKSRKQGEQEKAALMTKVQDKEAALAVKKEELRARQEEFDRLAGELEAKKDGWRSAEEEKLKSRDEKKAPVRPDIMRKYEMIRSRRGGLGLVLVKDEICQGCFTHIPPQIFIMLKKGTEEIHSCPHCHRLLYAELPQAELEAV